MDKYLITSFRSEIANAILNMQDKLNPNKDAYIDESELPALLDFFGVDDVSKLLKTESEESIFGNPAENDESQDNEDTVEISDKVSKDDTINDDVNKDDAINEYGTAAFELNKKIEADLSIGTVGNPYTQQINALEEEQASKIKKGVSHWDTVYKIDALKELVEDHLKENPDAEDYAQNFEEKDISYGNGKKARMRQTFGLSGNNAFKPKSEQLNESSENSAEEENETSTSSENSDDKNSASAIVNYNIDFRTLNETNKGNWHIKGTVNAGSENSDIHGAIQYTKVFKNSSLNFTGDIRETIEDENNIGSYGASVDYRYKKFSTGAYGMYYHKEVDGEKEKNKYLEMYGKYGNTFIGSAGLKQYNDEKYKYVRGLVQGKRDFSDSNLSINGGFAAEYGIYGDSAGITDQKELTFKAKGGISFKSEDLSADISANAATSKISTKYSDGLKTSRRTTAVGVLGKIDTKIFNISTLVSAIKVKEHGYEDFETTDDKTSVTASIVIGIKKLFGKNAMPILKYNTGNYKGAAQNVGVGVILTP
ncbi:hypothetical protein IKQ21_08140 [bacterium]|nr:hypothetical protein [bacterium]